MKTEVTVPNHHWEQLKDFCHLQNMLLYSRGGKKKWEKRVKKKSIELWKKVLLSFPLHLKLYGHKNVCV